MFHTKKSVELSFNTIIIAVLCLIVLIVITAIFRQQIGDVARDFTRIRERETDESVIGGIFGCSEGSTSCKDNAVYVCRNSEWVEERDCGPKKCKGGACV